jgi:hypothetical protein
VGKCSTRGKFIQLLTVVPFSNELRNSVQAVLPFESPTRFPSCRCQPTYRVHKSLAIVCIPTVTSGSAADAAREVPVPFMSAGSI